MTKISSEEFIKKAKKVHGDRYVYTKTIYCGSKTKVAITCVKHGDFKQRPDTHLGGGGCITCAKDALRHTSNEFIVKANKVHNNKYNYSLVTYKNNYTPVKILCPKHGEFKQSAGNHLDGKGCIKCGYISMKEKQSVGTDDFIKRSNLIHGDLYDYSLVKYVNKETKVKIICPKHGQFKQRASFHMKGHGCPKCANNILLTTDQFIKEAKKIHKNKYDYSQVEYINSTTLVNIICRKHGKFMQAPISHKSGSGCPVCSESKGEKAISLFLINNDIKFNREFKFNDCRGKKRPLPFDFYLPEHNTCIEYDGKQHYEACKHFGGEKALIEIKRRDSIKTKYCLENKIKLIRISYKQSVDDVLLNNLILFSTSFV